MSEIKGHGYTRERGGRSIRKARTANGVVVQAQLQCACGFIEQVNSHNVLPPEVLDRKFRQKGWDLDPAKCPECQSKRREERSMATQPSEAATMATAKAFKLLQQHFNEEAGRYGGGYSDKRVADECKVSLQAVATLRTQCFGELKEDPAIAELRGEIAALEKLATENHGMIQQNIAELRTKLARISQ